VPLTPTADVLSAACRDGRAVGAFNVITLEHAEAVVTGAEAAGSPGPLPDQRERRAVPRQPARPDGPRHRRARRGGHRPRGAAPGPRTALNTAFTGAVRDTLTAAPTAVDPRPALTAARRAMADTVASALRILSGDGYGTG
jgi:fructose/tagatose bisphosphate aldolase